MYFINYKHTIEYLVLNIYLGVLLNKATHKV